MKAGSFTDKLIPSTYIYIYNVRSYSAVIYSTLISLTVFLAVKKCAFVTMHGGSAVTFLRTGTLSLLKICKTRSFVKQKMISMQVCTFLDYGISGIFMTS